jgi:predicted  nucleic acid-binding Zn-ribbon protein
MHLFLNLCQVHVLKICAECTWRKFVRDALDINLCGMHLLKICAECTWRKFVRDALDTNLCGMHLLKICAECTWRKFVRDALDTNLCGVHLMKICAGCTWRKFVRDALDTNLCGVHLIRICAECTWQKFVRDALDTNSCLSLYFWSLCTACYKIAANSAFVSPNLGSLTNFWWFSCWNRVLRSILVRGGPSETGTRASVLTEPVINWSPRALRLSRAVAMSAREFRRLRSPHWLASGNQWSIVG